MAATCPLLRLGNCHEKRPSVPPRPIRRRGVRAVPAARLSQGRGLHRRGARPADRRHPLHRLRLQPLPQDRAAGRRSHFARRPDGRRAAVRVPDRVAARGVLVSDLDAAAKPDGDGRRGDDQGAAARRRGADRRLRQDHSGRTDGRDLGRHAGDRRQRRLDAGRQARGHAARRLHRLPAAVGAVPRRHARRAGPRTARTTS